MSRMLHAVVVWVVFLPNNFLFPPDDQIQIQDMDGASDRNISPSLDLGATGDFCLHLITKCALEGVPYV